MTTIKEISIQEVGQPYSIKIERGQKGGYGYEIGVKAEYWTICFQHLKNIKEALEAELYGGKDENPPRRDTNPV